MNRERQARKYNEKIILGGVEYQIESVEGYGGSSIVYRAVYRDELNRESFHQVLIKELFPYSQRGKIWRDEDGCIVVEEEGKELMESARESFVQGNKANLELLRKDPEQISGNLNSFEAYGTCYSVLTVHGGSNLEELISQGKYRSLAAAAEAMMKLLDALECFHRENILHLDISPDNILMLKRQALLIDYNSTWSMDQPENSKFYFSEKAGYSAPEIYLRRSEEISPATDLYSACAVFFRMVTGRKMDMEECMGRGLRRSFPKTLESFQGQPVTAVYKTVEILTKGLHILSDKRYRTIGELRADIKELIARIEGKGISVSALWENSRSAYLSQKKPDGQYLSREIRIEMGGSDPDRKDRDQENEEALFSEEDCMERLTGGAQILLKGTGGMGKTQYLHQLWGEGVKRYQPKEPVILYIPLEDYQQSQTGTGYIRRFLLKNMRFSEETNSMEDALHELERLFAEAGQKSPRIILLLDGLNEAGNQRQNLLREIEELSRYEGLGILVTDRTDSVKQYGLAEFETASLVPLTDEMVKEELINYHLECPKEKKLQEMLRNPMMLYLYRSASVMSRENGGEQLWKTPENLEEMVGFYIENLQRLQKRRDSGNEASQLAHDYLLEQLLPAIAGEMKKRKKTILSMEELYGLISHDYRNMKSKGFGLAFPKYMGKSRLILNGISNDREWFDYAVSEQLIGQMNLMEQTAEGNYALIHDNFVEYLVAKWAENQKRWKTYQRKYVWKRSMAGFLAVAAVGIGAAVGYQKWKPYEIIISEEERKELGSVTRSLNGNVGCLDGEIQAQYRILKEAGKEEVLENTSSGREALLEVIKEAQRTVALYYNGYYRAPYSDGTTERTYNYLDTVLNIFPMVSKETLSKVYTEAEVQKDNLMLCTEFLAQALCEEDSEYFCVYREERADLLEAYQQYLEAVAQYYYLIYNEVYNVLDEETQTELKEQILNTASFPPDGMKWSLGSKTEEELQDLMVEVVEKDSSVMKTAQLTMARCRFPVKEMKWPF